MAALAVEEVEAIPNFLDRYRVFLCAVLEDELLEEEKGALMRNLLSDLHQGPPCVLRRELSTILTLTVLYEVLNLEHLLEDRRCENLLLDRERDS